MTVTTEQGRNVKAKDIILPNVRKLFLADPGYTMYEGDLKGADAQVVAWEAEDEDLKMAFRAGLDVHAKNAEDMWGSAFARLPEGSYARKKKRQNCKVAVHMTNYGGFPRTLAVTQGWTVHEADTFQKRWFSLHPGIKHNFHGKVLRALNTTRTVYNKYGFRRVYFDRPDACFGEALAWIPQSTVGITCNKGFFQLRRAWPAVEELLQNHDAVTFQFPPSSVPSDSFIRTQLAVVTPYDDPLIIPWDLTKGTKSWGELGKAA